MGKKTKKQLDFAIGRYNADWDMDFAKVLAKVSSPDCLVFVLKIVANQVKIQFSA